MKPWSLPSTLHRGGLCLVLAALAAGPGGAQERPRNGEGWSEAREPERSRGGAGNVRAAGEESARPRSEPGEGPRKQAEPERARPQSQSQSQAQPGSVPKNQPRVQPRPQPEEGARLHSEPARPGPAPAPARPVAPPRQVVTRSPGGGEIHRTPTGSLREVHTPTGAVIRYAPDGLRRVEVARPDGRVFVASPGGRGGYIQRPLRIQGQPFVQRTYVERGVVTARIYRPWAYRGVTLEVYQPCRYYRPAYYVWARRPWGRVYYNWGWSGQPWFGYYRGWCAPYPVYPSPVFWLTDFMLAVTLEDAYQARLDSAAASAPPPPPPDGGLTPDVKQAIADEVQRQMALEQAQQQAAGQGYPPAPGGPPPLFSDAGPRVFLVNTSIPVYRNGQEQYLGEGDVVQIRTAPPLGASYADAVVLASRNPSCPKGSVVSVGVQDLQEMENHLQATLDQGLGQLQTQGGQNGLPAVPPQDQGASNAPYLGGVQPDPNAAAELSQVAQDASRSGQGVLAQGGPAGPAPSLRLGMTVAEVHQVLGTPRQSANVGGKLIEVFPDFKVTYLGGQVTDIQ